MAVLLISTATGCKQRAAERMSESPATMDTVRNPAPPIPVTIVPVRDFLAEQQTRRQAYLRDMQDLRRTGSTDKNQIRKVLLKYKGEVLMAQRDVKAAAELNAGIRDSLLKALEQESFTIAQELLTAAP